MCQTWCKILFVYFLIESDSNYLKGKSVMSQDRGKKKKQKQSLCCSQGDHFLSLEPGYKKSAFPFHRNHYYLAWVSSEMFKNFLEHKEVSWPHGSGV